MNTEKNRPYKNNTKEELPLTPLEFGILVYIKQGLTSGEIAQNNNCSVRTIEKHRSNIIRKLDIASSQNALLIWILANPKYFNT